MADVTVKLNHFRQAPRKIRLVIDLIRGSKVEAALNSLAVLPKRAALPIRKLLQSAVAAAKSRDLTLTDLRISSATCDQGPALKRRRINARGRSSQVKKFLSHVTLTISDVNKSGKKTSK